MKRSVKSLIKRIIAALSSKTNELRTRIMIFFLLHRNQSLLLEKFQAVVAGRRKAAQSLHRGNENDDDDDEVEERQSFVVYTNTEPQVLADLDTCNPSTDQVSFYTQESSEDGSVDLTETLFKESEEEMKATENEDNTSVNIMVKILEDMEDKKLDEEAVGEDDIDHAADVFIQRFRKQILLQKQLSLQERHSSTKFPHQNNL